MIYCNRAACRGCALKARCTGGLYRQIRALVVGAQDRAWTHAERALYDLLVEEWLAALQAEMVTAA